MGFGDLSGRDGIFPATPDTRDRNEGGMLMPKVLILLGIVLVAVGLAWLLGERLGLGRLPGDIVIEREGLRIYLPLMTSLIISLVLSLVLWFLSR